MTSFFRIIASFAAFSLLAACGLKGPLYLPKEPPGEQAAAQPPKSVSQKDRDAKKNAQPSPDAPQTAPAQ